MALLDGLGNKVFGNNFIGRESLIRQLQNECTSQNFSIVGLPKIGKSSLVYHSIIYQKEKVTKKNNRPFIPVFVDCGPADSINCFFDLIIRCIYQEFINSITSVQKAKLINYYTEYKSVDNNNLSINALNFIKTLEEFEIDIVIILDEFDRVRTIDNFDGTKFALLRTLLELPFINIITISKRSLSILERWNEDPNHNPSPFSQCFRELIVGNFNKDEWDRFWNKIGQEYVNIIQNTDNIKKSALPYTGYNPYWTACFAKHNLDSSRYGYDLNDTTIKNEMANAYRPIIDFMCDDKNYRNNILETVVQSILGPIYRTKPNDITSLVKYGLLTVIDIKEKKNYLGCNKGLCLTDTTGKKTSYIASNIQFTLFMISELNLDKTRYWIEWDNFFSAWYSLLNELHIQIDESRNKPTSIPRVIISNWSTMFKPIFNEGFEWFSTQYNFIIKCLSLKIDELPIKENDISRRNKYLTNLTIIINNHLNNSSKNINVDTSNNDKVNNK